MHRPNKRDLPDVLSAPDLTAELRGRDEPVFEGFANRGVGVFDILKAASKQVLLELRKDGAGQSMGKTREAEQGRAIGAEPGAAEKVRSSDLTVLSPGA